jgi:outer membrane protein assembly factor BamA
MKSIRRLAILFAALIAVPPLAAETLRTKSITFEGTQALKASALKKVMSMKFPSRFAWLPWVQYPEFNEAILKRDVRSIGNLYQSEGYYHSTVEYALARDLKKSTVRVRIKVDEGKPSKINEVRFLVDGTLSDGLLAGLEKQILLRQGKTFRIEDYSQAKDTAERFLANHGYSRAAVTGQVVVVKAEHHADITFSLHTGPFQYFGDISLIGNETVRDIDILRELSFKKGDIFSREQIARSQRRIFRLGLFRSVEIIPDETEEKDIPADIEVEENEKRSLNLGVGYGTEDRLRLSAGWTRRYLFGRPRTLTAAVKYSSCRG